MDTFKKLEVRGKNEDLISFLKEIKNGTYENFTYVKDKSDHYALMISESEEHTATFLSGEIENAIAYIWLVVADNLLYVTNVTPHQPGQLSYFQYNTIITRFFNEVIKVNVPNELLISLSNDNTAIEELAGAATSEKLKLWVNVANLSTLNTNPHDFKRWCAFIFSAHKTNSNLNSSQLERYLIEEVKIHDEELVNKVVLEYEYSLDILKEYDSYNKL